MTDGVEDPWRTNVARFPLRSAQVTAIRTSEEMVVLHGLDLMVEEGRQEVLRDRDGKPAPSSMTYFCRVTIARAPPPDSWALSDASIVISGQHGNGSEMTIAGSGIIGWDNNGNVEIEFEVLPQMSANWPDENGDVSG